MIPRRAPIILVVMTQALMPWVGACNPERDIVAATPESPPAESPPPPPPPGPDAATLDHGCIDRLRNGADLLDTTDTGAPDRRLFRDAMTAMTRNDFESARKLFLELTETHPASAFAPIAYLQFGDLFLHEGKPALAENFYHEVLRHKPPHNVVFYLAALQLASAQHRQNDDLGESLSLAQAASGEHRHPDMPCVRAIATAARRAMTTP